MSSGVATRYAKAIFGLAKEDKQLDWSEIYRLFQKP